MSTSSRSKLASFSTCELSDALIKIGLPHGGHIPDIRMVSHTAEGTICGKSYTVKMVHSSDSSAPKLSEHFVDTASESSIIVIDAPQDVKNAVWGGLMSAGAQAKKVQGVVISGRCRDLAEHRTLGFPVFARGTSTLGQSPFTRPSAVNVPIVINPENTSSFPPITVNPDDWIVADEDGVICVPKELENQAIDLATNGRDVDARCMEDIKAGLGVQASFKKHRGK